jgi:hypothetical protein
MQLGLAIRDNFPREITMKNVLIVALVASIVAVLGVMALKQKVILGPVVLGLGVIPIMALLVSGRALRRAVPDLVFGAIDTGLLTIPALWGAMFFGVAGAIAGGVIGDALTDGIAGFFEGSIAEWFRRKGIEESREGVTSALGKMSGCLLGSGLVLTIALVLGMQPVLF